MFKKIIFSQLILNWYHKFGRKKLPWKKNKNIYNIWISEIMLQQTKVKTVIPYYKKFIKKYPNFEKLSKISLNKILKIWKGLGYYNRAKNIYKTILIIKNKHNGIFPTNFIDLINLPGIGKTTAGAILSLSLDYSFPILDTNIKRILIRINNFKIKKIKEKKLWELIEKLTPIHNTGKFNQAMMDIGSKICTFKKPKCINCPIKKICKTYKNKNI